MNTKIMRILSIAAGVSILIFLLVGDLLAVLSDKDTGTVAFEYSDAAVSISLSVAAGAGADTVVVEPGQSCDISVSVTSTGEKDSYLLLEFDVPRIPAATSGEPVDLDLFELRIDDSSWFTVKNEVEGEVHTYVFGYGAITDTLDTFAAGAEVSGIVESAVFHDFSSAFAWSGSMEIKAYAIQTTGYEGQEPSAVWTSVVALQP